jgi:argininosuccinate lyase
MDVNAVFRGGGRSLEFLDQINKASLVMLAETGILPQPVARRIAQGIAQIIAEDRGSTPRHTADYLDYEPRLIAAAGPDASRLHTGRSRQDLSSTIARMNLRDGLLQEIRALIDAREKVAAAAEQHQHTIIPAFTHGVQAQPTTYAHYVLALAAMLERHTSRLLQAYARVNQSPLGSAALATSSFPLDRERLAVLLGFNGLVENAYDANHLGPVDSALEVAGALANAAVQLGQFAQDIHAQYSEPVPWFMLAPGELTGVSSIMPQKRNPAALEQLRAQASLMVGDMQSVFLLAHNTRLGMFDYRMYDPVPCGRPLQIFKLFTQIIASLVVNKERALNEVAADYSTTTEIADALLQRAQVPFRVGHHFASKLTDFGRSNRLKLHEIPYAEAARIYRDNADAELPLSEAEFREVISPGYMVFRRSGRGGPQLAEIARMLAAERACMEAHRSAVETEAAHISRALGSLDSAFAVLAS